MAYQKGQLVTKSGKWYVRYYEKGKRVSSALGSLTDFPNERDILPVKDDFMRKVNQASGTELSAGTTVGAFTQEVYLPKGNSTYGIEFVDHDERAHTFWGITFPPGA